MGFVCFNMYPNMLPKTLITLLHLFQIILYSFSALLYRLGLNPSFETELSPWENEELLFSAEPSQSVLAEAASVKNRLPTVDYMSFVRRSKEHYVGIGAQHCIVCLQFLEARDRVRELGNCRHAFHVGCIDTWIDIGRFSCPLCRAAVLPLGHSGRLVAIVKFVGFGISRVFGGAH